MKIIDKNTDYYDYYQDIYRDDTFTFDRRESYNLTREEFASKFSISRYGKDKNKSYVLLQICCTYWLFELTITKASSFGSCEEYQLDLIDTWKDYNKDAVVMKLSALEFPYWILGKRDDKLEKLRIAIQTNDCKETVFNKFRLWNGNKQEIRTIPILKNIGIPAYIDALDIYLALEEYFSTKKTNEERTEARGATNNDKITAHGFDTVTSFRNVK